MLESIQFAQVSNAILYAAVTLYSLTLAFDPYLEQKAETWRVLLNCFFEQVKMVQNEEIYLRRIDCRLVHPPYVALKHQNVSFLPFFAVFCYGV